MLKSQYLGETMRTCHDVAKYILEHRAPMTAMKLQKLLYYSQAWSLVWDERPLFKEQIQAWANGPVVPEAYDVHRGDFMVSSWPHGDPSAIDTEGLETIESVLHYYGDKSGQYLSELTHAEDPWRLARGGLADGIRGNAEITWASMAEYYGSL